MLKFGCCVALCCLVIVNVYAQETAIVKGFVKDSSAKAVPAVSVAIPGTTNGVNTNEKGYYELTVPANKDFTLAFSLLGYKTEKRKLKLAPNQQYELNILYRSSISSLPIAVVEDKDDRNTGITKLDVKNITLMPNPSGNLEGIIKTLPGVSSNNELSSQYSVRGGNFDENLVYINDVEVYRPFLVRAGQQEGLSIINTDMVQSVNFSAGGFESKYGDKMSSVLDIKYKHPVEFAGSASYSLLGGSLSLEGASKDQRFTFMAGVRQKNTSYLLNTLDTKGDYKPSFLDFQTYLTYAINDKWELSFLGSYSNNTYQVVPQDRTTTFGTVQEAMQLQVYFDGQEIDTYDTYLGALTATYKPSNNLKLKFITSAYSTSERESYDIQGQYYIDELQNDLGKSNFGQVISSRGIGTYLDHSRSQLDADVFNVEHKGYYNTGSHYLQWGAKAQHEEVLDNLKEWKQVDSAGFTLPKPSEYYYPGGPQSDVLLQATVNSSVSYNTNRYSAYVQDSYTFPDSRFTLTAGVRGGYWSLNNQYYAGPRGLLAYRPRWKKDIVFRVSSGYYIQPPFYKELRDLDGNFHNDLKPQTSIHYVIGGDYNFRMWERPFKYTLEAYYKYLYNLIPYIVDDVRIRYYGANIAKGFSTGLDMRINGEFVPGVESWASLSLLRTMENINNLGYTPRPTDQRLTATIFFQDYIPKHPSYKVNLTLTLGTGVPFAPPSGYGYSDNLRTPPYRRVDIGFSKQLIGANTTMPANMNYLKYIKNMWISLEVFNLLDVQNTVSYLWLKDITNQQYAIPNYLTSRQVNLRLIVKF